MSLNHYRLKRKFSSTLDNVRRDFSSSEGDARYHNPYREIKSYPAWRKKLDYFLIISSILAIAILLIMHPFFQVKKVTVEGTKRLSKQELNDAVIGVISYKRLGFLNGQNYFLVNVENLRDVLKERYPLSAITVKKSFPDSVQIYIEEKNSTILYDSGKQYGFVGTDGKVTEILRSVGEDEWNYKYKTVTTTNEKGEEITKEEIESGIHKPDTNAFLHQFPDVGIVYDSRKFDLTINNQVLDSAYVGYLIKWFEAIKNNNLLVSYIEITDISSGDAIMHMKEGWQLKFKVESEIESQLDSVVAILKQPGIKTNSLNYIDVRYKDRIYWK